MIDTEPEQIGRHRIIIQGIPIAKKRPKFARRGNFVTTYNPQETEAGKFWLEAKSQWPGEPLKGAVAVILLFVMPIPKGTSKKKEIAMCNFQISHTKKPDLDNCEKFVFDCLKGVAWLDDSQVVEIYSRKEYGLVPKTEIYITEYEVLFGAWQKPIERGVNPPASAAIGQVGGSLS